MCVNVRMRVSERVFVCACIFGLLVGWVDVSVRACVMCGCLKCVVVCGVWRLVCV